LRKLERAQDQNEMKPAFAVKRKWSDRVLPSEMKTVELIAAKRTP